jgi:carboxyl-terminal processing protease
MESSMQPSENSPIKTKAGKYFGTYLGVILFVVAFGAGFLAGRNVYFKKYVTNAEGFGGTQNILINGTAVHPDVDLNQFWQVFDEIKAKYVKQPVSDKELITGAMQGLVAALNDPYSLFLPPQQASDFTSDLAGELEGIGAEIGVKNNQLMVISPIPETPAEKAGLKPGDAILFINKESTAGMDAGTAVTKIRGKAGTQVTLAIMRSGWTKSKDIVITRQKITVPSVTFKMKPGNIAYIQVLQFNDTTVDKFYNAIDEVKKNKARGIVLDLRNNPGGYLDSAIAMASEWVKDGVIVSEKGMQNATTTHETAGKHRLAGLKTVVLINKGSASASEIVAGALQDHKAATLVGEKSFGKGSVQDYENFPDGSALKITVAEWFTPNGKNINKEGITPDVLVPENFATDKIGVDKPLDKALEILKKK